MTERFTNDEKRICAERELKQRLKVYARLVDRGRMSLDQAAKETQMMTEIAGDYRKLAEAEQLI